MGRKNSPPTGVFLFGPVLVTTSVHDRKSQILSIIERLPNAGHVIAIQKLPTAFEAAKLLVDYVFKFHKIPVEILSNTRPQFVSQAWKAFCTSLWANMCLNSGFHIQTNRQLNQELETALRFITTQNPSSYSTHMSLIEYADNSSVSSAAHQSSLEAPLGYQPPLFPTTEAELAVPSVKHHLQQSQQI